MAAAPYERFPTYGAKGQRDGTGAKERSMVTREAHAGGFLTDLAQTVRKVWCLLEWTG